MRLSKYHLLRVRLEPSRSWHKSRMEMVYVIMAAMFYFMPSPQKKEGEQRPGRFSAPMRSRKGREYCSISPPLTDRPAWKALKTHYKQIREVHLRQLFADDPQRGKPLLPRPWGPAWITRKIESLAKLSSCSTTRRGIWPARPNRRHVSRKFSKFF